MTASVIYEPSGRAREYAGLACNVYAGCDHGCTYCYAPNAMHTSRPDFARSHVRDGFIERLTHDAAALERGGRTGQVLLSFATDPYQHLDVSQGMTRAAITILKAHWLNVCVLTKGGRRALRDLDLFTPSDAMAATMTFLDDVRSREWEPRAAPPMERMATLHAFHDAGIPTWVSLEPVLDPEAALAIIRETHAFVDMYKVGKLNYHPLAKSIGWAEFAIRVIWELEQHGYRRVLDPDLAIATQTERRFYIKRDLAHFL
jgi:DNA repair photolyase